MRPQKTVLVLKFEEREIRLRGSSVAPYLADSAGASAVQSQMFRVGAVDTQILKKPLRTSMVAFPARV